MFNFRCTQSLLIALLLGGTVLIQNFTPIQAYVPNAPSRYVSRAGTQIGQIGISNLLARRPEPSRFRLHATSNEQKKNTKKGGLDESVRTKLVSESIAPWRTLRLFLYFSLGSGALVGGLITLTGLAAVLSGAKEGDVNTEFLNLGIDFGAVTIFALLAKYDFEKGAELNERVEERLEKKKEQQKLIQGIKNRELELAALRLAIQISPDGTTRDATVQELQSGARQHMIIVAGPKKACRDALVGANLLKMDFAMSNVLVVPYETVSDEVERQTRPEGTGFGDRPIYERQAYVARATGPGWDDYISAEMNDAVEQNGEKAREEGIAIVVASNGKVLRRGVGKVPWRQMVEQLDETVGGGKEKDVPWLG